MYMYIWQSCVTIGTKIPDARPKMLLDILRAPQRASVIAPQPRGGGVVLVAPPAEDEDAARREKLKQLFGIDELQRGPIKQTAKERQEEAKKPSPPPDWMMAAPPEGSPTLEWRASWLTLWLQDSGVNMDSVLLVEAEQAHARCAYIP